MIALYGVLDEYKRKYCLHFFTAGVFLRVLYHLYGIESSDNRFVIDKVLSDPQTQIGQKTNPRNNIKSQKIIQYENLEMTPKLTAFELRDENNENLKVHLEYTDNSPSNFAEGK
jgi:cytochrome c-type biogenesis protein CcmE